MYTWWGNRTEQYFFYTMGDLTVIWRHRTEINFTNICLDIGDTDNGWYSLNKLLGLAQT